VKQIKNMTHEQYVAAMRVLLNYEKAHNEVSAMWLDLGMSFEKDYPFQESFDEIKVKDWVHSSIAELSIEREKTFSAQ
jgi:hypothetical protein